MNLKIWNTLHVGSSFSGLKKLKNKSVLLSLSPRYSPVIFFSLALSSHPPQLWLLILSTTALLSCSALSFSICRDTFCRSTSTWSAPPRAVPRPWSPPPRPPSPATSIASSYATSTACSSSSMAVRWPSGASTWGGVKLVEAPVWSGP
jgi:hypothetical protein